MSGADERASAYCVAALVTVPRACGNREERPSFSGSCAVSDVTPVPQANGAAADAAELAFALPPGARGAAGLSPRLHEGDMHVLSLVLSRVRRSAVTPALGPLGVLP
jgi:hypothetical protein